MIRGRGSLISCCSQACNTSVFNVTSAKKIFTSRVNCYGLVSEAVDKGVPETVGFSWIDHNIQYLIATREYIEVG